MIRHIEGCEKLSKLSNNEAGWWGKPVKWSLVLEEGITSKHVSIFNCEMLKGLTYGLILRTSWSWSNADRDMLSGWKVVLTWALCSASQENIFLTHITCWGAGRGDTFLSIPDQVMYMLDIFYNFLHPHPTVQCWMMQSAIRHFLTSGMYPRLVERPA